MLKDWFVYFVGAAVFPFLAGVASYGESCAQKIMKLENSMLADKIRAYREQ